MARVAYKQRCSICKKNMVLIQSRRQKAECEECQEKQMQGEITDPVFKKMFDIDPELYKKNQFLRSIKIFYLRYERLSERQIEAFQDYVAKANENAEKKE